MKPLLGDGLVTLSDDDGREGLTVGLIR